MHLTALWTLDVFCIRVWTVACWFWWSSHFRKNRFSRIRILFILIRIWLNSNSNSNSNFIYTNSNSTYFYKFEFYFNRPVSSIIQTLLPEVAQSPMKKKHTQQKQQQFPRISRTKSDSTISTIDLHLEFLRGLTPRLLPSRSSLSVPFLPFSVQRWLRTWCRRLDDSDLAKSRFRWVLNFLFPPSIFTIFYAARFTPFV